MSSWRIVRTLLRRLKQHLRIFLQLFLAVFILGACSQRAKDKKEIKAVISALDTSRTLVFKLPVDTAITYLGRWDKRKAARPRSAYSGTGFRFKFWGDTLGLRLENKGYNDFDTNYVSVFIDGEEQVIALANTDSIYRVAGGLSNAYHQFELRKRTESRVGRITFHGIVLRDAFPLRPSEKKKRFIEFVGNSITCGYGNQISSNEPKFLHFTPSNENFLESYAAKTAIHFDADYRIIAYSGIGITRDYSGVRRNNMLKMYLKILPDDFSSPKVVKTPYPADVVIINLGTNDFVKGIPNQKQFVANYLELLKTIHQLNQNALIICTGGTMISDIYPRRRKHKTTFKKLLENVVSEYKSQVNDKIEMLIYYSHEAPYGEDWHPTSLTHTKMANRLIPFLEEKMSW